MGILTLPFNGPLLSAYCWVLVTVPGPGAAEMSEKHPAVYSGGEEEWTRGHLNRYL